MTPKEEQADSPNSSSFRPDSKLVTIHESPSHLDILSRIVEPAEPHLTLKEVVTLDDKDTTEEKVYRMALDKKTFEVKTKSIRVSSTKTWRIAVVKDQSVYEDLIKKTTVEKCERMLISSITHEIRNPLNAIEGYLSMLQDSTNSNSVIDFSLKIRSSAQQIDLILAGACDLLLTEDVAHFLQPQEFDLEEEIKEVVDIVSSNIKAKEIKLTINVPETVPSKLLSDPKKYKLILFNLLANATKYTEKGEICINAEYDPGQSLLKTEVSDTGVGMNEEQTKRMFELYANIEQANAYNPQGMGLGLTLCKKLSEILGGSIKCNSSLGKGTKVEFSIRNLETAILPLEGPGEMPQIKIFVQKTTSDAQRSLSSGANSPNEEKLPRKKKVCGCATVLVVDDEASNRTVLKHYLNLMNVTCDEAENGIQCIESVEKRLANTCCKKYDLILMDINMPGMDGTEATTRLLKLFSEIEGSKSPIVAVTAANMQTKADVQSLLSVGFTDLRMFHYY